MPDQTPHESPADLQAYRLNQTEKAIAAHEARLDELEKWPDRVKLIAGIIVFASPLVWKIIDKIWP